VGELRNLGGETVAECAARMLREHERDRRSPLTARAAAHLTATACAKSWRTIGHETMSEFYWRVAAQLAQRVPTEAVT